MLATLRGARDDTRVVHHAVDLARTFDARLTVLSLAAVEEPWRCCNGQTTFWNAELRRLAMDALESARQGVPAQIDARFVVRDGRGRATVNDIAMELGCDVIVAGGRRGRVVVNALG